MPDPSQIAFLREILPGISPIYMKPDPFQRATPAAFLACAVLLMTSMAFAGDAGGDFSVNEGDTAFLGATAEGGGDFLWTQLPGGTAVALEGADTATPSFVAPDVPMGGETLTFLLTVSSGNAAVTDTVNVTVVNVNHPPVADAGQEQIVAVGSPVVLSGENSFDIDNDPFTTIWVQTGGPRVILKGSDGVNPSFVAPHPGDGGVATLTFRLLVDDGFPMDSPAPGYVFGNVTDTVSIIVTDTNNTPFADAGEDQTVAAATEVMLDGRGSFDPDGDVLSFSWIQEPGGIPVLLAGADSAMPSFIAPAVDGSVSLFFTLTVDDGYGGVSRSRVTVYVLGKISPPLAAAARPTISGLWPPDHRMVAVGITGVAGGDIAIEITSVSQDEPTRSVEEGDTPTDAFIQTGGTVLLRAERSGKGDGRVYHIHYTATNAVGVASGTVRVAVPRERNSLTIDGGGLHDSLR